MARNILKTASAAELKDTYVRLAADFDNFRRRSATDLTNAKNMALTGVLKDLTTVLDNFDLAKANVKVETDKEISIKKSYDAVGTQLTNAITKMGVEPIKPLGEKFDPMFHEAIQQVIHLRESQDWCRKPPKFLCFQFPPFGGTEKERKSVSSPPRDARRAFQTLTRKPSPLFLMNRRRRAPSMPRVT